MVKSLKKLSSREKVTTEYDWNSSNADKSKNAGIGFGFGSGLFGGNNRKNEVSLVVSAKNYLFNSDTDCQILQRNLSEEIYMAAKEMFEDWVENDSELTRGHWD